MKVKFEVVLDIPVNEHSVPNADSLVDMLNDRESTALVLWNEYYEMEIAWATDYKYQLLSDKSGTAYKAVIKPKAKPKVRE